MVCTLPPGLEMARAVHLFTNAGELITEVWHRISREEQTSRQENTYFLCILVSVLGKRLHITSLSWGRPCCSQRSLVPLLASCAELLMMCEVGLVQSCRHRFDCFKRLCFPGYLFTLLTIFPRAGFYSCSAVRAALMQPCLRAEQTLKAGFSALRR